MAGWRRRSSRFIYTERAYSTAWSFLGYIHTQSERQSISPQNKLDSRFSRTYSVLRSRMRLRADIQDPTSLGRVVKSMMGGSQRCLVENLSDTRRELL